jgi:Kef-type K+ transport system membrane component KefB
MRKVFIYSLLLVAGLVISQFLNGFGAFGIKLATMFCLSFIMIHVGCEFEIDKSRPKQYAWDYVVAGTAAAFPWILCALYFVFVMAPRQLWGHGDMWKEALLQARFSSPTSAGVLFSMLAAAGLSATWLFKKARVLAIFDDLDTILLMIPLKMLLVGLRWQLMAIVVVIVVLLWLAWRYLHQWRLPTGWPWMLLYAGIVTGVCEAVYLASRVIDDTVPVHLEVLLPAFVLGCLLTRPAEHDAHAAGHANAHEQRVSTIVSACFMVLVGLSMPPIQGATPTALTEPIEKPVLAFAGAAADVLARKNAFPGWGWIAWHVVIITLLSNLGKMFPALCYRREASWRERLAVAVGMFPRGEVGAGVLVISLSYGLGGPVLTVAVLSLALNLLLTGVFIAVVKKLIASPQEQPRH